MMQLRPFLTKAFPLSLLGFLLSLGLNAQATVSTVDFFRSAPSSGLPTTVRAGTAPAMPWVENYELRTETRDFDPASQEYTLRLSPSTGRKRRAQANLARHYENAPDLAVAEQACDDLARRYFDWLELYEIQRKLALKEQIALVSQDVATVLRRQTASLDFDWSRLIKIRQQATDRSVSQQSLDRRQAELLASYGLAGRVPDFTGLAPLETIMQRVKAAALVAKTEATAYELAGIAKELELERAEQRQYVDFAQIKYQGPHDDPARERISVGLGLQLPNSGNQRLKIRELEMESAALKREQQLKTAADEASFARRRQALIDDYQHYRFIGQAYATEVADLAAIADQIASREGFNPLPLLEIKLRQLDNEQRLLNLEIEVYEAYLELEERGNRLCQRTEGEALTGF